MNPLRWHAVFFAATIAVIGSSAAAQQPSPRIGYIYPAGGRQGSTFEVQVGGQFLDGVADAYFSGDGVKAKVIEHTKPMSDNEANSLRDRLKELQGIMAKPKDGAPAGSWIGKKPSDMDEDGGEIAEIRKKLATFIPRNMINRAICEKVRLQVTIDRNAQLGGRDLRLRTPLGLTNPRMFCVDQLPEFSREPAKVYRDPKYGRGPRIDPPNPEMNITLPAIVNGQIMPGTTNRFRFKAHRGERLVVAAAARRLIPYLPDAVPGWFQATLELFDADGKPVAYDDDYRFNPDPVLFYLMSRDGEYTIEIKDSIYRGREDFVYRIALGQLPFITSIFPLGGKAGEPTTVSIKGWNLPLTSLTENAKDKQSGIVQISARKGKWPSNQVPFALDYLPECLEQEPNDKFDAAQAVAFATIVNGRVGKAGDRDMFRFDGRAGVEVVVEVHARRLDSPLDSVVTLSDSAGRQLAFNDDCEDKGAGLSTHYADSWFRAKLPANGSYYVRLGDTQHKGGSEYAYRLRISPPRPDFDLRLTPSSISVRAGGTIPLTMHALRRDGFAGEIELSLKDAPDGFMLAGGILPANQDQVRITLTAPARQLDEPVSLSLEGRATIQGRQVIRPAVPAEDMMQAFAYRHLVPVKQALVVTMGRRMRSDAMKIISHLPVRIPAGGTVRVRVSVPAKTILGVIILELSEPPDGIAIANVTPTEEGSELELKCDAKNVKPGLKGNLIVNAFFEKTSSSGDEKTRGNVRRMQLGTLPAMPFEVVEQKP